MFLLLLLAPVLLGHLASSQECIDTEIRTVREGGNDFVQYCVREQWRLLCTGKGLWTRHEEATVACRQLGYIGGTPLGANSTGAALTNNFFRFGGECVGTENSVQECGGPVQELDDCLFARHGTVVCDIAACTNGEIRLVNGSTNREGRVEVCVDGRWGTVCNNQEGLAGAVCAQLGFPAEGAYPRSFAPRSPPNLNCTVQSEASTLDLQCIRSSCYNLYSLGVVCRTYQDIVELVVDRTISETTTAQLRVVVVLGTILCVLVIVLMLGAIGWILTCAIMRSRKQRSQQNTPANPVAVGDEGSADQPVTTDNPAYEQARRDQGEESAYEVVDR